MADIGKRSQTADVDLSAVGAGPQGAAPGKTSLTSGLPAAPGAPATEITADEARDLGANERVLSKDPKYAADGYLTWFRDQAKAKLLPWDLAFDPASVSLATVKLDGATVKAVILAWDPAWGPIPTTRDFPLSLTPLDASASVAAAKALPGWAKVPAGDQGKIANVLCGEENQLSSASRNELRPTYKTLKGKTEDEQATALKGLIDVKSAMPSWATEPMQKEIATVTLAGPTEKKDFEFRGKKADAEEWIATYSDGVTVPIVAPKAPTAGHHNHSVQEVADAAGYMPKSARAVITRIMLNPIVNPDDAHWAVKYNRPDFHSYMTAGEAGIVTIYPNTVDKTLPGNDARRSAMVHETGHTWSYKNWGNDKTKGKWAEWKTAMDTDKLSVSGYAMSDIAEDVAETIRVYVSTKGTPRYAEYERMVPKRFAMLKTEYDK